MLPEAQSQEQLVAELAALRHRVAELQALGVQPAGAGIGAAVTQALNTTLDGLMGVDAAGHIVFANAAACRIVGWPADEAVAQRHEEVLTQVPADGGPSEDFSGVVEAALTRGVTHRAERARLRRRDGVVLEVRLVAAPVLERGRPNGVVVSIRDNSFANPQPGEDRRALELEALVRISETLVLPGELQEQSEQVLDELMKLTEADRATLLVPDADGLKAAAVVGLGADQLVGLAVPLGLSVLAYQRGESLLEADYPSDPMARPELVASGVRSLAAAPVVVEGRVLGVVALSSVERDHFTPMRVRLLNVGVDSIGVLIEKSRLRDEERNHRSEVEALFAIARVLAQPMDDDLKVRRVLSEALGATGSQTMGLALPSEDGSDLRIDAMVGPGVHEPQNLETMPARAGMVGTAFAQATTVVVRDYPAYPSATPAMLDRGAKSAAALPVRADGVTLGVLIASADDFDHYTPERVRFLTAVTEALATLLSKSRLDKQRVAETEAGIRRIDAFREAAARLAIEETPDQALQNLVEVARGLIGASVGAVTIWDRDGAMERVVSSGLPAADTEDSSLNALRLPEVMGLVRYALVQEGKKSLRVGDGPPEGSESGKDQPLVRTLLAVPFACKDGSPGAFILLEKHDSPRFTVEDERLLNLFAVFAAVLLDNIALYGAVDRERNMLNGIQTSMAEGLIVLDAEGRVVFCNRAAKEAFGVGAGQPEGKRFRHIMTRRLRAFVSPDAVRELLRYIDGPVEAPQRFDLAMTRPKRMDLTATVFPIEASATERLTGILMHDVTDERELHRRRDTFVSVASHELRTPMTTIMGFTELLMGDRGDPEQRRAWLNHVYDDSRRVVSIVDDLLNVSRIESGRLSLNLEPVDLGPLLESAVEGLRNESPNHKIICVTPDDLPAVQADRDKLAQVVLNFVSNAVKYSPEGGDVVVAVQHRPKERQIVLSVSDKGVGIAPEDQERLFATFERIYRSETADVRGSGLGLYIVKGLVELMGGTVWLKSEVNRGSTFYAALPVDGPSET